MLYSDKDKCVHYRQVEDHEHVLMCKDLVVVETRETLWETLENNLVELDTHPDLLKSLKMSICLVKSKVLLYVEGHLEEQDEYILVWEQNNLG